MPGIYQSVITWNCAGQLCANVLHWELEELGAHRPDQYAKNLVLAIGDNLLSVWVACISNQMSAVSTTAQKIDGDGGPVYTQLYGLADFVGARTGSISNSSECIVIEFPVLLHEKNVTGKVFMNGLIETDVVNNVIADTAKTFADSLGDQLLTAMTLEDSYGYAKYTIYNRAFGFSKVPAFHRLGLTLGSQRRRLRP